MKVTFSRNCLQSVKECNVLALISQYRMDGAGEVYPPMFSGNVQELQ